MGDLSRTYTPAQIGIGYIASDAVWCWNGIDSDRIIFEFDFENIYQTPSPTEQPTQTPSPTPTTPSSGRYVAVSSDAVYLFAGVSVLVLIIICCVFCLCMYKRAKGNFYETPRQGTGTVHIAVKTPEQTNTGFDTAYNIPENQPEPEFNKQSTDGMYIKTQTTMESNASYTIGQPLPPSLGQRLTMNIEGKRGFHDDDDESNFMTMG